MWHARVGHHALISGCLEVPVCVDSLRSHVRESKAVDCRDLPSRVEVCLRRPMIGGRTEISSLAYARTCCTLSRTLPLEVTFAPLIPGQPVLEGILSSLAALFGPIWLWFECWGWW